MGDLEGQIRPVRRCSLTYLIRFVQGLTRRRLLKKLVYFLRMVLIQLRDPMSDEEVSRQIRIERRQGRILSSIYRHY